MNLNNPIAQRIIETVRQALMVNSRLSKLNVRNGPDDDPRVIFSMDDMKDKKREYRATLLDANEGFEVCLEVYDLPSKKLSHCEFVGYKAGDIAAAARRIRLHINGVSVGMEVPTGGFRRGEFMIFGAPARASYLEGGYQPKSMFSLQAALAMARQGKKLLHVSLER